jgi:hypothetical protein
MATLKLSSTERIRRFLLKSGIDTPASRVVEELAKTGCQVTHQSVYNVRSLMKSNRDKIEKVEVDPTPVVETKAVSTPTFDIVSLVAVGRLAEEIGGLAVVQQCLIELEKIQGKNPLEVLEFADRLKVQTK